MNQKASMKTLSLHIATTILLCASAILCSCSFEDSDFEELKAMAAKESPMEISAPDAYPFVAEDVPTVEPETEEGKTVFNHYIENLAPKRNITVTFNGENAVVTGASDFTTDGAHVTITTSKRTLITINGSSGNGSLTILPSNPDDKDDQARCGIKLNGVNIHNPNGAAINSQLKKRLLVDIAAGTENTLSSGDISDNKANGASIQAKGCLFSEDKIIISCSEASEQKQGKLTITSHSQSCIAADDYLVIRPNTNIILNAIKCNGIKTKDGVLVWGGQTTIFTEGETRIRNVEVSAEYSNGLDTVSCAGIKTDSDITINNGLLQMKCTGEDTKGIKCDGNYRQDGGQVSIVTLARKVHSAPKGVKCDGDFCINSGMFYSYSLHSSPIDVDGRTLIVPTDIRKKSYLLEVGIRK